MDEVSDRDFGRLEGSAVSERDFGRLEGKVDAILEDVREIKTDNKDKDTDFEQRIRGLERWRWGIPGTLIATIVTFLIMHVEMGAGG